MCSTVSCGGLVLVTLVCLLQSGRTAHWSDRDKTPVHVQSPSSEQYRGPCPDESWTVGAGSCYKVVNTPVQWIMAEYFCKNYINEDAIPVKITSKEENDFVWKLAGDRTVWLGLQDISHPERDVGVWQWSDGTNITRKMYKNWYPGSPNGDGESCAQFWEGGQGTWDDDDCREEFPFICELDIDECAQGLHSCSRQAICENTDDGYECTCGIGYTGNGHHCEREKPGQHTEKKKPKPKKPKPKPERSYKDLDKCVKGLNRCAPQAICENVGDTYRCTCAMGYVGDGFTCERETPALRQQKMKAKAEEKLKTGQGKEGELKAEEQPKEEIETNKGDEVNEERAKEEL